MGHFFLLHPRFANPAGFGPLNHLLLRGDMRGLGGVAPDPVVKDGVVEVVLAVF